MSRYTRMKVICFFDLPTETNDEKRAYRNFRKILIENGFFMLQYSVYVRTCPNRVFAKKYIPKLKAKAPAIGSIRFLIITEKQYDDMVIILGDKSAQEIISTEERIIVI